MMNWEEDTVATVIAASERLDSDDQENDGDDQEDDEDAHPELGKCKDWVNVEDANVTIEIDNRPIRKMRFVFNADEPKESHFEGLVGPGKGERQALVLDWLQTKNFMGLAEHCRCVAKADKLNCVPLPPGAQDDKARCTPPSVGGPKNTHCQELNAPTCLVVAFCHFLSHIGKTRMASNSACMQRNCCPRGQVGRTSRKGQQDHEGS